MNKLSTLVICLTACALLSSCASNNDGYNVVSSRLASGDAPQQALSDEATVAEPVAGESGYTALSSLQSDKAVLRTHASAASKLSISDDVSFAADKMPAEQFIHTVLGDILKLNYVIADGINNIQQPVTLNLQQAVSSRQLYLLSAQVLDDSNIAIALRDGTYFVHAKQASNNSSTAIGIGRDYRDVPQVVGQIMQIVPIKYGMNISLERTLRELINGRITPDFEKNMLFITGERSEILRALDLVALLDMPANRGRNVGILRLTYITAEDFIGKAASLLDSEGIPVDKGSSPKSNIVMVPLEQIGAVALFGSEQFYIDRVNYWAKQLDKPSEGAQKRYYIFHPRFARASDLGASVAPLIDPQAGAAANRNGSQSRDTASAFASDSPQPVAPGSGGGKQSVTVSSEDITMTVDERSNTIIFYTSGIRYQGLLPMIRRLDIMPKQILLEATIAEVTLTDDLSMGLEFAMKNGKFGYSTKGAFGVAEFGGLSLSYLDVGKELLANLKAAKTKVNVLSNPSLLVRDGVNANINVGTDVPTAGSTSINPGTETQTTNVEYRKTGVSLSVTPTINAQGLVVLEIDQKISNTTEGGTFAGSPAIFERSLKTEVLAQSGQTIMLGGLISENTTKSTTKVPFLGDIPGLGALFRGQKDSTSKTELIILITPRVLDQPEQWQHLKQKLNTGLQNLQFED
jgi:general secretion pathway protein D